MKLEGKLAQIFRSHLPIDSTYLLSPEASVVHLESSWYNSVIFGPCNVSTHRDMHLHTIQVKVCCMADIFWIPPRKITLL